MPVLVGANEIPKDAGTLRIVTQRDAETVSRDQVTRGWCQTTNHVPGKSARDTEVADRHTSAGIPSIERSGKIRADEVAGDRVVVRLDQDAAATVTETGMESEDIQSAYGASPGTSQNQPTCALDKQAAQLDLDVRIGRQVVGIHLRTRLGIPIDQHPFGNGGKRGEWLNEERPATANIESDRIESRCRIGVGDRLAKRARTRIPNVVDDEIGGSDSLLQRFR